MIVDNATLEWARSSHPRDSVREVAETMLMAGPNPVDQAERLADLLEDSRGLTGTCWLCTEDM
jgi:hypothetical protein